MSEMAVGMARNEIANVINRAAYKGERITLTRRGKAIAAVVPVEDLLLLERLEDEADIAAIRQTLAALDRGDETTIPLDEVIRKLAL